MGMSVNHINIYKVEFVESIKIRRETKRRLIRYRASLEAQLGRKVSLDEAISRLLDMAESRRYEVFLAAVEEARSSVRRGELVELLERGRAEDEAGG